MHKGDKVRLAQGAPEAYAFKSPEASPPVRIAELRVFIIKTVAQGGGALEFWDYPGHLFDTNHFEMVEDERVPIAIRATRRMAEAALPQSHAPIRGCADHDMCGAAQEPPPGIGFTYDEQPEEKLPMTACWACGARSMENSPETCRPEGCTGVCME